MARTMFPNEVQNPYDAKALAAAKAREAERQKWDPSYLTRDQAAAIPQQVVDSTPGLRARIDYSRQEWPEHRAVATVALGDLPQGTGETVEDRSFPAEKLFSGATLRAPEE